MNIKILITLCVGLLIPGTFYAQEEVGDTRNNSNTLTRRFSEVTSAALVGVFPVCLLYLTSPGNIPNFCDSTGCQQVCSYDDEGDLLTKEGYSILLQCITLAWTGGMIQWYRTVKESHDHDVPSGQRLQSIFKGIVVAPFVYFSLFLIYNQYLND